MNPWIEFLKKNGGQQKTRAQLSREYRTCCKQKNSRAIAKYSPFVARKSKKAANSSLSVARAFAKAANKSLSQDEVTRHDPRHYWGFSEDLYRLTFSKSGKMGEVSGNHVKMSITGVSYGHGEHEGMLTCEVTHSTFSVVSGRNKELLDEFKIVERVSKKFETLNNDEVASFVADALDKLVTEYLDKYTSEPLTKYKTLNNLKKALQK